jgi:hypothetical protein
MIIVQDPGLEEWFILQEYTTNLYIFQKKCKISQNNFRSTQRGRMRLIYGKSTFVANNIERIKIVKIFRVRPNLPMSCTWNVRLRVTK